MVKSFATELNISEGKYFGGYSQKLSRISSSLQTDLKLKVELLLNTHLTKWRVLNGNENYSVDKDNATAQVLSFVYKKPIPCPACGNTAVIYFKPIIEKEIVIGTEVKKLKCQYCKLEASEPGILDYLGIKGEELKPPEACASCGGELPPYSSGICVECEERYGMEG